MSLLSDAMEECTMMNKVTIPDGYGGKIYMWSKSSYHFDAAITFDTSIEARRAEAEGVKSLYTVTTSRKEALEYHDVFLSERTGKIFRVTSDGDDKYTPKGAGLDMEQVTAEEWVIPSGQITGNT